MVRQLATIPVAAVLLSACLDSQARARKDLDRLCVAAGEISIQRGLDGEGRLLALMARAEAEITSTEVKNIFGAFAGADPEVRPRLLAKGAEEIGAAGWRCPALEAMWSPRPR